MTQQFFFGYGSLVNERTHDYPSARPARLKGWRREWRLTHQRPVAFLSVRRAPDNEIDGLVAAVPGQDWLALDIRETGYDRHLVSDHVEHDAETDHVQVYALQPGILHPTDKGYIQLSYLDVVVQGFLHKFGTEGVGRFFETTDGWDRPIADDRRDPHYPRHQRLTAAERTMVDLHLERLGVAVVPAERL